MTDQSDFLRQLFHADPEDQPAIVQQPIAQPTTDAARTTNFLRTLFSN